MRAYAYLTTAAEQALTVGAEKRLKILSSLDNLGAGFTLASHDLDMRGGGNLLGEEQSGHIREVGVELYQSMLEEAVAVAARWPRGCGQRKVLVAADQCRRLGADPGRLRRRSHRAARRSIAASPISTPIKSAKRSPRN